MDDEHLRLIDELQLTSYIGVPLKARGQVIGAFTIAMAESGRHYTERDLEFAQALADRAALAIDNARLFQELEAARVIATRQRDQTEERFRLMVEGVKDYAIFMLDPTGVVTTWNAGAERIKGYTRRRDHRPALLALLSARGRPPPASASASWRSPTREGRYEDEGWRVRKDGSRFWANVVITADARRAGQLIGLRQGHPRSDRAQAVSGSSWPRRRGGGSKPRARRASRRCSSASSDTICATRSTPSRCR